jgi:hypothetical protein
MALLGGTEVCGSVTVTLRGGGAVGLVGMAVADGLAFRSLAMEANCLVQLQGSKLKEVTCHSNRTIFHRIIFSRAIFSRSLFFFFFYLNRQVGKNIHPPRSCFNSIKDALLKGGVFIGWPG